MAQFPDRWNWIRRLRIYDMDADPNSLEDDDECDDDYEEEEEEEEEVLARKRRRFWNDGILHTLLQLSYPFSADYEWTYGRHLPITGISSRVSWTLLTIVELRVEVNKAISNLMEALNSIPQLRELAIIWEVMQDSGWFPPSRGLQLPHLRSFRWDGTRTGVRFTMNERTVRFLVSSQFMKTCSMVIQGHLCNGERQSAELAPFFQHHEDGVWNLSDLHEERPWVLACALQNVKERVACSLKNFILCMDESNGAGFAPADLVQTLPRELMVANFEELYSSRTAVFNSALKLLHYRTALSPHTNVSYLSVLAMVLDRACGGTSTLSTKIDNLIQRHGEVLEKKNIYVARVRMP
jgi:hypothetical protein